jgi:hypothetical protein
MGAITVHGSERHGKGSLDFSPAGVENPHARDRNHCCCRFLSGMPIMYAQWLSEPVLAEGSHVAPAFP